MKRFAAIVIFLSVLFGCASAPVQEMSDARQSIEAAREAGALRYAPANLKEAEEHLEQAKQLLDHGQYDEARARARLARELALEAQRKAVESNR